MLDAVPAHDLTALQTAPEVAVLALPVIRKVAAGGASRAGAGAGAGAGGK